MADIIDQANDHAEYLLQAALDKRARQPLTAVSATHCVDCEDAIPPLRREKLVGCQTCVDCQRVREVRRG